MDCSLPGSSAHGVFQARVLEWGAIVLVMINWRGKYLQMSINVHFPEETRAPESQVLLAGCG